MVKIFPSLLTADHTRLMAEIKALEAHCDGFHLDLMDGHVAPNLAFSYSAINTIAQHTQSPLFIHAMVEDLQQAFEHLKLPKGTIFSFHPRVTNDPERIIKEITKRGWVASIAYEPDKESTARLYELLNLVHHILIMAVPVGLSGQPFMPEALTALDEIYGAKKTQNLDLIIAMDGAITKDNIAMLAHHGVEQFCVGTAIFGQPNRQRATEELYAQLGVSPNIPPSP